MITVHKYPLRIDDHLIINMPGGARVLHVGFDPAGTHDVERFDGWHIRSPSLWALVNTEMPLRDRRFRLAGTGHSLEPGLRHIGSFVDGAFVWHLFEDMAIGE